LIIEMLKGKIHRATVTGADLNYIGSLTLDENLMDAAGFIENEKVQVLDITNGNRIDTYIIRGEKNSNEVCINGAAAHLINKDDLVIIISYCILSTVEAQNHKPIIVYVNSLNQVTSTSNEESLMV